MRLLLAAGGTGGHVFPALALAAEAKAAGHQATLLGASDGPEAGWAADAKVPFVGVPAGKWDRQRPDPRQAWRAVAGVRHAVRAVRRQRPDAVVGFGGFASFPGCAAAAWTGTPLVLHEGNAFPGRVTRWFARRAACVALALPEAAPRLAAAPAIVTVGFPVREARHDPAAAREALGLPAGGVVTWVMGGSQGSAWLNAHAPEAYRTLDASRRGTVLHAAGPRGHDDVAVRVDDLAAYHVVPFADATLAWSAADLAITRAGVGTLSEAAYHGVPLVMVPLPSAAEDHQRHNARAVRDAGGGRIAEQGDPQALSVAWAALLDPEARHLAADAIGRRSPRGAAARLLAVVEGAADPARPATTRRKDTT
ncbi:MAG: UDP-N-acetylglucosamine--N-acetylmuramyl-(pentapeptide) pyrophosphoryl-undecaprenol N-acetylglucosamine transferase [Trueperaceae bacterium]|nr:UDP-N-acetylglucosamine--N-acetylmuramyl-(pentapeptide) pyrophosphoryl-undecaprenol N-acetylglucosamine transferase [Trueperaceae bacterium]